VDDDGGDAGVEVAEGDEARLGRHLEEEPWPGESRMKSTNEMNTGAQSCIFFNSFLPRPPDSIFFFYASS